MIMTSLAELLMRDVRNAEVHDLMRMGCADGSLDFEGTGADDREVIGEFCTAVLREDVPADRYGVYSNLLPRDLRPLVPADLLQELVYNATLANQWELPFTDEETGERLWTMHIRPGAAVDAGYVQAMENPDVASQYARVMRDNPDLGRDIRNICFYDQAPLLDGDPRPDLCNHAGQALALEGVPVSELGR